LQPRGILKTLLQLGYELRNTRSSPIFIAQQARTLCATAVSRDVPLRTRARWRAQRWAESHFDLDFGRHRFSSVRL